jgi:hypothetical protein
MEGEELWKLLESLAGAAVISAFKFTLYPINLCPHYLNPGDLKSGTTDVNFSMKFGTGENGSRVKFKDVTFLNGLQKIVDKVIWWILN